MIINKIKKLGLMKMKVSIDYSLDVVYYFLTVFWLNSIYIKKAFNVRKFYHTRIIQLINVFCLRGDKIQYL